MQLISIILYLVPLISGQQLDWWEGGNFYQIYPRSFKDSDGDGVGDLRGITTKIQYLKDLGMDGVWLSPIYKSPQADFGYDISDYRDIDPTYGTLEDFEYLVDECNRLGVKLILDFVPNHTSDEVSREILNIPTNLNILQHDWFKKSEARVAGYENYYIWRDGKIDPHTNLPVPPNNWISFFRYSAWRWSNIRKQFYLHQFHYKQPDINYRDPGLVQEMKNVLTYWLEKGVSGFRIDIIVCLFEKILADGSFPDEPIDNPNCDYNDMCYLKHIYTQDQDETFEMAYDWRALLDNFKTQHGGITRIMMTESWADVDQAQRFYGNGTRKGSYIPFNFELIKALDRDSKAADYKRAIDAWLNPLPQGVEANWVIGNHDKHRAASRLGPQRGDLINILIQTLPGVAITYMGEELVMENVHLTWEETVDPQACNTHDPVNYEGASRDPARTPFPWDETKNGGFSTADITWLPAGDQYKTVNVKAQEEAQNSHLKIFKKLTTIRKQPVFRQGEFDGTLLADENVYAYKRQHGTNFAIVVLNLGKSTQTVNLKAAWSTIPNEMKVYTSSLNSKLTNGQTLVTSSIEIMSDNGIVLLSSGVTAVYSF